MSDSVSDWKTIETIDGSEAKIATRCCVIEFAARRTFTSQRRGVSRLMRCAIAFKCDCTAHQPTDTSALRSESAPRCEFNYATTRCDLRLRAVNCLNCFPVTHRVRHRAM